MIFLQPLEMRLDRSGDFPRVLYREEMPDNLTIVLGLPREVKRRIFLLCNFSVGHHLDLLRRIWRTGSIQSLLWDFAIHQPGFRVEGME
jgi:hypothetical protein